MAKTLSTDNYLQITRLMQAPVAEPRNIIVRATEMIYSAFACCHLDLNCKDRYKITSLRLYKCNVFLITV